MLRRRPSLAPRLLLAALIAPMLLAAKKVDNAVLQQIDTAYDAAVADPRFEPGTGPRLCQDEGHHDFHTSEGRFAGFAALMRADGYRVAPLTGRLSARTLRQCDVLVIANAQPSDAAWEDYPKPTPSAFAPEEVTATRGWVEQGGALLLIADHMPLAGAASAMAGAFGFHFTDGFAIPKARVHDDGRITIGMPDVFRATDGGLAAHEITDGRIGGRVSQVATFIGQAFWADPGAEPLLVFPEGSVVLFPAKPWSFDATTPRMPAGGWLQGATRRVGAGRVAAFGEAAMFTAQIASNKKKMGLNAPGAEENARFTRNLMAWLSGVRDGSPDSATHDP